jgi:hypothetical protein
MESSENILAFTEPNNYFFLGINFLRYQRLVGVSIPGAYVGETSLRGYTERSLKLPEQMGMRLLEGMRIAQAEQTHKTRFGRLLPINCHLFGRLMTGMKPSLRAPFKVNDGEQVLGSLREGELGIVGTPQNNRTLHSLIGLGEGESDSIQEMWGEGILGLVNNDDLISFVQRFSAGSDAALYRKHS